MSRRIFLVAALLSLTLSQTPLCVAQGVLSNGPSLATLEEDWNSLSIEQRNKWVHLSNRYEKLPPADRELLKSRMSDWAKLSTSDRRVARANFINSLNIPNDKKAEAWEAYRQLSPEERKQLTEEAAEKNKTKKPSLVNSPSLKN